MNEINPILVSSLNAVLLVALPLLAAAAIAATLTWARKQWDELQRSQPTLAEQLEFYARIAVEAAEQAGASKIIERKKEYALKILSHWLLQVGLGNISTELLAAEIERQVREMNMRKIH